VFIQANDPAVMWVNIANILLGLVVVVCGAVMIGAVLRELLSRARARRTASKEIDRDIAALVGSVPGPSHALRVPGLGLTMADGGEPLEPTKPNSPKKSR
jgi:hypothetical protein